MLAASELLAALWVLEALFRLELWFRLGSVIVPPIGAGAGTVRGKGRVVAALSIVLAGSRVPAGSTCPAAIGWFAEKIWEFQVLQVVESLYLLVDLRGY